MKGGTMADGRDDQRADIERQIQAHRQWLVTNTEGASPLTASQYAKWRAELTALEAKQRRLATEGVPGA